jgi:hypothetical protein
MTTQQNHSPKRKGQILFFGVVFSGAFLVGLKIRGKMYGGQAFYHVTFPLQAEPSMRNLSELRSALKFLQAFCVPRFVAHNIGRALVANIIPLDELSPHVESLLAYAHPPWFLIRRVCVCVGSSFLLVFIIQTLGTNRPRHEAPVEEGCLPLSQSGNVNGWLTETDRNILWVGRRRTSWLPRTGVHIRRWVPIPEIDG